MAGKIAVLASKRGTVLQGLIDAAREGRLLGKIDVVISECADCGAIEKAKAMGIDAVYLNTEGKSRETLDQEIIAELEKREIDLVLLIGYMKMLGREFVERYGKRTMNIHPSMLPAFAGGMDLEVHRAVLDAGVKVTGCTLHFISAEADAGPIVMQKEVPVMENDTAEVLKKRVQDAEKEIVLAGANKFLKGKIKIEGNRAIVLD